MSNNATIIFAEILASIPPTINPFLAIESFITSQFYPPIPQSFSTQLYVLAGVSAMQVIVIAVSLVIRAKNQIGEFWIFKLTRTANGTFITPHFAVAWQLAILAFVAWLVPYCFVTISHARGHEVDRYLLWKLMPWGGSWMAAWCALWAISVAQALPSNASPRGRFRFLSSPTFLNIHYILGVAIVTAVMTTLAMLASRTYDHMVVRPR
ncbi:hypothetical protein P7C70_g4927, partial [Phenoliferia sp. Uapishka_3]